MSVSPYVLGMCFAALMAVPFPAVAQGSGGRALETRQSSAQTAVEPDSVAIITAADQRIALFMARWQAAWLRSDATVIAGESNTAIRALRTRYGHCDYVFDLTRGYPLTVSPIGPDTTFAPILSDNSGYALCPSWLLGPSNRDSDEATYPDAAIRTADTLHIGQMREDLIRSLDGFQDLLPKNDWLRLQRVRFLVDAPRFDRAERAFDACGETFSCLSLRGYVA